MRKADLIADLTNIERSLVVPTLSGGPIVEPFKQIVAAKENLRKLLDGLAGDAGR